MCPVRCLSCGKPVAGMLEEFKAKIGKGEQPGKVLDDLGLDRYCCRTLLLTHQDIIRDVASFRV